MSIDDKWLDTYYAEVGREIGVASSQLHETTNWSIGITMAAVTAVALSGKPYPQVWTLAAVIVAFVLVMRFFVRSCLAYANLCKWSKIHRDITEYRLGRSPADGADALARIEQAIRKYHIRWRSPKPISALLWSNLKLGYLYLFVILSALLAAGVIEGRCQAVYWALLALWLACVVYEAVIFPRRTYLRHEAADSGDTLADESAAKGADNG